ncbi:MAG: tRNA pseudouridine(55) synthase TruB [Candidatus Binatia bacterium]
MGGLLLIDKPEGLTSADAVRAVKRQVRCKTGHLGTLDPFASGILPLCVGEATKIAQFLNAADKEYVGLIRLGAETDTGDPTGTVIATAAVPRCGQAEVERVARQFVGETLQTPPMHSAIKHQGTPLYKLARQGIAIERQPRPIRINALCLTDLGDGRVAFSVASSKGTYIRVLAQQIAIALGTVGHLEALRRTRFGSFPVEDAIALDALGREALSFISLRDSLRHLREIEIDAATAQRARRGDEAVLQSIRPGDCRETVKLVDPNGALVSVIVMDRHNRWRFARVFADGGHVAP